MTSNSGASRTTSLNGLLVARREEEKQEEEEEEEDEEEEESTVVRSRRPFVDPSRYMCIFTGRFQ
ncbi:hypothetical protein WN55_07972 [Dufourea novaeangliae]|uniref:Uncharacterized protein n=1 Tax=Dufourea novaeangliae TaxID=178035 RepID=A0A154P470_DUFNO|nr:hypothetical protein WN55_07972 [Dufourea novaeangliae]